MSIFTPITEPSYRQRLGYQSMLLGGICCMVAMLILVGNVSTHGRIAKALEDDQLAMLAQVIPADLYDNNLLDSGITVTNSSNPTQQRVVFVAKKDNQITAFAFPISSKGYSGDINMMMAINRHGEILGVRVINHAETPGLGDKIEIAKDDWITSFNSHSLANTSPAQWAVKKDGGQFDQFTGATITPRAVVKAVYEGLNFYAQNKAQFTPSAALSEPSPKIGE